MINPIYLQDRTITELQNSFQENELFPAIILYRFLDENFYQGLQQKIIHLPFLQKKEPLTHSYATVLLPKLLQEWLDSSQLQQFLEKLFHKKIKAISRTIIT